MNLRWTSVTSGLIVGAALGFVIGYVSALSRMATPAPAAPTLTDQLEEPTAFPSVVDLPPVAAEVGGDEPVYFPEIQRLADAAPELGIPRPPATLPNAADAVPIESNDNAAGIRALIDAELRNATPQQREVWSDVLGGLPPEDALGILQLWQTLGRPPSSALGALPTPLPQPVDQAIETEPNLSLPAAGDDDAATLRQLRKILVGNLLNAQSVGYRRVEPQLSDHQTALGAIGVRLTGTRIDQSQGNFISTGRSLDLAIQGEGFFSVQDEGRTVYTRCGRLELDAQRRLCIRAGDKVLLLQPEIVLPANVRAVNVETSGDISVTLSAGEEKSLGRIPVATFLDAHALQPLGDGLLAATRRSGAAQPDHSGHSAILQQVLEQSNVDPAEERRQLDRIDDLLTQLATTR